MIETPESRAAFQARRAKAIAAFKHAIKGELPLDAVGTDGCKTAAVELPPTVAQLTEAIKGRAEAESKVAQHESKRKQRKRDKYWWREYRKRPRTCPHCGKEI